MINIMEPLANANNKTLSNHKMCLTILKTCSCHVSKLNTVDVQFCIKISDPRLKLLIDTGGTKFFLNPETAETLFPRLYSLLISFHRIFHRYFNI